MTQPQQLQIWKQSMKLHRILACIIDAIGLKEKSMHHLLFIHSFQIFKQIRKYAT